MRKLYLLLALLFLCGCQTTPTVPDGVLQPTAAYFLGSDEMLISHDVVISTATEDAQMQTLFSALQSTHDGTVTPAIPRDVHLLAYSRKGSALTLSLSEEYDAQNGILRTLSDAALTLSYCSLEEIDSLIIQTPTGESAAHTFEDYLLTAPTPVSAQQTVDLYFVSNGELVKVPHAIRKESDVSFPHSVVSALLSGPEDGDFTSAIPSGTALHSLTLENGTCTVDLSSEFLSLAEHTETAERLCLFSLVNTVAGAAEVHHVQILIDGVSVPGFTHYDLTQAIQPEVFD